MLVLTRRLGESIIINKNIEIRVIGINGKQIRLGINAPKEMIVDREEIHIKRIMEEDINEQQQRSL